MARLSEAGRRSRRAARHAAPAAAAAAARRGRRWRGAGAALWSRRSRGATARAAARLADVRAAVAHRRRLRGRRGLAGQVPPARRADAGSASPGSSCCITFVWFSAPDLALTQLVVEVGHHRADPARPALAADAHRQAGARARAAARAGAGAGATCVLADRAPAPASPALVVRDADAAVRRRASRPSSSSTRCPRAAAPTSST